MKIIGITGGTGFIGQHLTKLLVNNGHKVVIFTTRVAQKPVRQRVTFTHWDPDGGTFDISALKEVDAVVHLGGAGIADKRWTVARKKEIVDSRVKGTRFLLSQLKEFAPLCRSLIAASAIGFYGPDREGAIPFVETSMSGSDFLSNTCLQWEAESAAAEAFLRTVTLRFGIVLGKESGAFPQFAKPMSFGIMPILGSGKQITSWIEINDLCRLILFALNHENMTGIYNAVSPTPVTQKQLMRTIANEKSGIKIPIPVPAFVLKILLGEMSTEVLKSCTVSAKKTLEAGFIFHYPDLDAAVKNILKED